jgi:hypothetical protein
MAQDNNNLGNRYATTMHRHEDGTWTVIVVAHDRRIFMVENAANLAVALDLATKAITTNAALAVSSGLAMAA